MSCCKSKTEKQNPTTISISENHDLRIKVYHLLAIWFQATPADIFHLIVNFWYHITCNIKSEIWVFGGRNAGKGTLVKQFCRKNNELSQIDVSEFLSFIHWSMMKDMQTLCRQVIELYKNHSIAITIAPETGILRKEFIKLQLSTIGLFPQIVGKMKSLWNDSGIKKTLEYRHLYKVNNHCEYFFDNIDAIIDPDQVPFEFYVRTRRRFGWFQKVKKQNIKHSLWMMNNLFVDADIEIIDINSSWYNWLHPQKHVEIIFVIPIGDYDLMGVNDRSISRLRESRRKLRQLSEWNAVLKGRLHRNPLMVLTKYDVFKQKIKTKSIANVFMPSDTFPFDKDPHNEQDGKQFVMDCFVKEFQIYNSSAYVQLNGPLNFIRVNSLDSQQAFNVINHRMREIVLQESEIEIKCVNL